MTRRSMNVLLRRIRSVLTPDLLSPRYRADAVGKCREYGHCYVATEALWHLIGGTASGYVPRYAFDAGSDTHWWLYNATDDAVLDPTSPQYTSNELKNLYANGRSCGFLTKQPSKRAKIVMQRVMNINV